MPWRRAQLLTSSALALVNAGCLDRSITGGGAPTFSSVAIAANPWNGLSTVATFRTHDADSARVLFWTDGGALDSTPFSPIADDSGRVTTLGLSAVTAYHHIVEARGPGGVVRWPVAELSTLDLPAALRTLRIDGVGTASEGYILVAVTMPGPPVTGYAVAFDPSGRICWYREFDVGLSVGETKQQPNGNFTIFLGETRGWDPTFGYYVEFEPDGREVRTYSAWPFYTDNHELLLTMQGDGSTIAHLFGYELRNVDLSFKGGPPNALVAGHLLLRELPSGQVTFFWNAWDHFVPQDWIEPTGVNPPLDFDHPNSLDFAPDGNYVVSFRHMGEVTKIDARTGALLWRFGGRNNQFTIRNDPLGGFSAQHTARVLSNGDILLYDNGLRHTPPESRAVEYRLDESAKTADQVWEFRHTPALFTPFAGSAQRLKNGNTLITFSTAGVMTEVDPAGRVAWEGVLKTATVPAMYLYRGVKVQSLYRYQRP